MHLTEEVLRWAVSSCSCSSGDGRNVMRKKMRHKMQGTIEKKKKMLIFKTLVMRKRIYLYAASLILTFI